MQAALLERRRRGVAEVAAQQAADFERYEQRQLLDELTDQSERLSRPMENGFVYEFGPDEKLYSEYGEQLEEVFATGLEAARLAAEKDPHNWTFEHERRVIELDEIREVQALQDGQKLIVFSPLPDRVRAGLTSINGYDRKRQKMLVRVAERQGQEVGIFSFSLDGSDYEAMQAAAAAVGADIPDGLGSEEILATRFTYDSGHQLSMKDCHKLIREAYDSSLERRRGGAWYAGRPEINQGDALSFIRQQNDLIRQHMTAVSNIMARALEANEKQQLLEMARYNFAAALDDRMAGKIVSDVSDAGDTARAEGREYDGDCPTSATAQAEQLGYAQGKNAEMKCVTCPFCGQLVDAIVEGASISCPREACGMSVDRKTGKTSRRNQEYTESVWEVVGRWLEEGRARKEHEKAQRRAARVGRRAYELAG